MIFFKSIKNFISKKFFFLLNVIYGNIFLLLGSMTILSFGIFLLFEFFPFLRPSMLLRPFEHPQVREIGIIIGVTYEIIFLIVMLDDSFESIKKNWLSLQKTRIFPYNVNLTRLFKGTNFGKAFTFFHYLPVVYLSLLKLLVRNYTIPAFLLFSVVGYFLNDLVLGCLDCRVFDEAVVNALYSLPENSGLRHFLFQTEYIKEKELWLEQISSAMEAHKHQKVPLPDPLFRDIPEDVKNQLVKDYNQHDKAKAVVVTPWGYVYATAAVSLIIIGLSIVVIIDNV